MSVIRTLQNVFSSAQIRNPRQFALTNAPRQSAPDNSRIDIRRARERLLQLHRHLEKLADLTDVKTRFELSLREARSSTGLGLDLTHTAAALNSIEEINASPMSFSTFGPEWTTGSVAAITIGGEYDGTHGSGPLTFEVRRPGIHGVNNLRIRLEDPEGNRIKNINIQGSHPEDRQYSLNNGLYLTLGPGLLIDDDLTTIQVFDNVGAAVDPNKPLGGIRNDNPNLQFGITTIANGSFDINGQNISVATTDTISNVVDRINLSSAGVTAAFNAASERIDFLQNTLGSVPTIDLQNDTSNLLQALKLSGASVVAGVDPETIKNFSQVAAFSGVQSGEFQINGTSIAIDPASDSLTTIIDRINASPADVVASFDPNSQEILISANDPLSSFDIDSNGTGFFAALNITEGRIDPETLRNGFSRRRSYAVADSFSDVFDELNRLFDDKNFKDRGAHTAFFRDPFEAAFQSTYGSDELGNKFGLRYDGSEDARSRGRIADVDRLTLTRDLQRRGDAVKSILAGKNGESGFVHDLLDATRHALVSANKALGISGTFVDLFV